jgi:hypothetical protein
MNEFEQATETFLEGAAYLASADMPLVTALREIAKTLDAGGVTGQLVNQYRLTYIALANRGNADEADLDPLEALLNA